VVCPATDNTSTRQQIDAAQWCIALQGAGETTGGSKAGAMIGGRGCVEDLAPGTADKEYLVTVAWQGQAPVAAPPTSVACGQNQYENATVGCTNDLCRRAVTTIVRIAALS
jgi:type IV pilus assembly protein PilV